MPACASGENGVCARKSGHGCGATPVLDDRVRAPVLGREEEHGAEAERRRDPRRVRAGEVVVVDPAEREEVDRGLAVGAGDVEQSVRRLVPGADRVQVHRPAVSQDHQVVALVRDVELVAVRVAAEVRERVEQEDLRVLAEAIPVVLRRREPARPGADDDTVVDLAGVLDAVRLDAGAAARRVDVVLVRLAVDGHELAEHGVGLPLQAGRRRRVEVGVGRGARGERRLGAGEARHRRGGGQSGRRDGDSVEEVLARDLAVGIPGVP